MDLLCIISFKKFQQGGDTLQIAIIGAGAMGSLYGGYLSKINNEVYLVDIWKEHVDKINDKGLIIFEGEEQILTKPKAYTSSKGLDKVDLAIIFVKSIYTEAAIKDNLSIIGENTKVLTLQNGYGNFYDIEKHISKDNIIVGTTSHGATLLGPGIIKHAGEGQTYIGSITEGGDDEVLLEIKRILEKAGFETTASDNVLELIWSKLFVNVGINALTGILEIRNGELLDHEETREILTLAVSEAVQVANGLGMDFDEGKIIENVILVAKNTAENKSSMLQDIINKRKTEIGKINGAVVKEGIKLGIRTPVNKVLTNMIKVKERI